jgi:hypothetical protein
MELEIDRERLCRYLRVKWLLSWLSLGGALPGIFLLAYFSAGEAGEPSHALGPAGVLGWFGVSLGGAFGLYVLLSHWRARRESATIQVTVEGAFLRIRQHGFLSVDRKLHFRAIQDYATIEGPLMRRMGVKALQMHLASAGPNGLQVPGVKDCEAMRDLLAQIDSEREVESYARSRGHAAGDGRAFPG